MLSMRVTVKKIKIYHFVKYLDEIYPHLTDFINNNKKGNNEQKEEELMKNEKCIRKVQTSW